NKAATVFGQDEDLRMYNCSTAAAGKSLGQSSCRLSFQRGAARESRSRTIEGDDRARIARGFVAVGGRGQ
ncbi:hypothetical protein, partial [Mesorhizobium sp.]|uniref:hypothetical protein n=1 Tax=Mesorhizobium sp. TaxID=1871066 RepID=UPI0025F8C741